jgi:shikimate kinase
MIVFLIGFMGAGKSSLGKRLANKLDVSFIDSDKAIEEKLEMSIAQVFEEKGEDFFRSEELKWLKSIDSQDVVIALGGGTPCFKDNITLINNLGMSVYLKVGINGLASRLSGSKTIRPLIEPFKHDREKLMEFVKQKVEEREFFYNQAKITFDAESVSSEKLDSLVKMIKLSTIS